MSDRRPSLTQIRSRLHMRGDDLHERAHRLTGRKGNPLHKASVRAGIAARMVEEARLDTNRLARRHQLKNALKVVRDASAFDLLSADDKHDFALAEHQIEELLEDL